MVVHYPAQLLKQGGKLCGLCVIISIHKLESLA